MTDFNPVNYPIAGGSWVPPEKPKKEPDMQPLGGKVWIPPEKSPKPNPDVTIFDEKNKPNVGDIMKELSGSAKDIKSDNTVVNHGGPDGIVENSCTDVTTIDYLDADGNNIGTVEKQKPMFGKTTVTITTKDGIYIDKDGDGKIDILVKNDDNDDNVFSSLGDLADSEDVIPYDPNLPEIVD